MQTLTMGYLDPFRPFCWSEGGVATGLFITALTQGLPSGITLHFLPGGIEELQMWLTEGRIDAIAAKAITPDRAGTFTFSKPLMQTCAALFGSGATTPPAIENAGSARIATPRAGPLPGLIARLAPESRVLAVADYQAALAAVLDGRADWAALNRDAGTDLANSAFAGRFAPAGPGFGQLDLAVAVAPGDPGAVLACLGLQAEG